MNKEKSDKSTTIILSHEELEALIKSASSCGAKEALKLLGLDDNTAACDIKKLRGLVGLLHDAQRSFVQVLVRYVTIGFLALLVAGLASDIHLYLDN